MAIRATMRDSLPAHITLYLTTPLERTERMLREVIRRASIEVSEPYPLVLAAPITDDELHGLLVEMGTTLSPTEQEMTKCWMVLDGAEPSHAQLMQAQALSELISWSDSQWLADILESERLCTHFQPIVWIEKPEDVYAYECLLRGTTAGGDIIPPARLYRAAGSTRMLSQLEKAARSTAIASAAQHELDTFVFININPSSFSVSDLDLAELFRRVERHGLAPDRLVFEIVESERIDDADTVLHFMKEFRRAGARIALDDVGTGYNSLHMLSQLKPDLIKLDMQFIREVFRDAYKGLVTAKLLEMARELGVLTVVEGVETEAEWRWMLEHGAELAQGYLFARPAANPPWPDFAPSKERASTPR